MRQAGDRIEVGLAFGSNLGDKPTNIVESVRRLRKSGAVNDLTLSSLYRTAPWGLEEQDWFVNACAVGLTDLAPLDLLAACKRVEIEMGRQETVRWGPRLIDIDILYMEGVVLDTTQLTLPHVEIMNRAFVLVPLVELRPGLAIRGVEIRSALRLLDAGDVVRLAQSSAHPPQL